MNWLKRTPEEYKGEHRKENWLTRKWSEKTVAIIVAALAFSAAIVVFTAPIWR